MTLTAKEFNAIQDDLERLGNHDFYSGQDLEYHVIVNQEGVPLAINESAFNEENDAPYLLGPVASTLFTGLKEGYHHQIDKVNIYLSPLISTNRQVKDFQTLNSEKFVEIIPYEDKYFMKFFDVKGGETNFGDSKKQAWGRVNSQTVYLIDKKNEPYTVFGEKKMENFPGWIGHLMGVGKALFEQKQKLFPENQDALLPYAVVELKNSKNFAYLIELNNSEGLYAYSVKRA